jgi:hypothetical protein
LAAALAANSQLAGTLQARFTKSQDKQVANRKRYQGWPEILVEIGPSIC